MAIDILYFGWVREGLGRDSERVTPPAAISDIAALVDWMAVRDNQCAEIFADRGRLRYALDQRFVGSDTPIAGAREIAIFPPVTGG